MLSTVTIPKQITHGEELVVISRQEYELMQRHLNEIKDALRKIRQGEKELLAGKTRVIRSLAELRR